MTVSKSQSTPLLEHDLMDYFTDPKIPTLNRAAVGLFTPVLIPLALVGCNGNNGNNLHNNTDDTGRDTGVPSDEFVDSDDDGFLVCAPNISGPDCSAYFEENPGMKDCNDDDPSTNPDADEICDGIDNNCDGEIDNNPVDGTVWYLDSDGDSFGDPNISESFCEEVVGYVQNDLDCDDSNNAINPDGTEDETAFGDEDCNGQAISNLSEADSTFDGIQGDELGGSVANAGDVTGDGIDDTIVGAPQTSTFCSTEMGEPCPGNAFIIPGGTVTGWDTDNFIMLSGENDGDWTGFTVDGNFDFDGDGFKDVVVGAPANDQTATSAGKTYVELGPITSNVDLRDSSLQYVGMATNDYTGFVRSLGDVDGDGMDELLVSGLGQGSMEMKGVAYLLDYSTTGTFDLDSATTIFEGPVYDSGFGSTSATTDVNGDGLSDVLIGASNGGVSAAYSDPGHPTTPYFEGESYIFINPSSGIVAAEEADYILTGENPGQRSSILAANGDANGDGYNDLLLGAILDNENGTAAGAIYLVHGPVSTSQTLSSSLGAKLLGEYTGDFVGNATFVDPDGDGMSEVLVGAPASENSAYILHNPTGTLSLNTSSYIFTYEPTSGAAGGAVANAGDLDNDGLPDIIISDPQNGYNGGSSGSIYLFLGSRF